MHQVLGEKPLAIDASGNEQLPFLPPNVVLHTDDATSKVFQAIARAFLSVDNKALTIKDLADLALTHGLFAQNLSAASQAITTYIRQHLQRCEEQNDIPLLCRHTLAGTPSDDQLLPALHSTSGGAHIPVNSATRATNFRRGTVVWYLSRATGAPCPFTRAGIRLASLQDNKPPVDRRLKHEPTLSLKRKRPLRSSSPNDSHSDTERPPRKVKFTLRLKPIPALATSTTGPVPKTISSRVINISDSDDSDVSMTNPDHATISYPPPPPLQEEIEPNCLPPYPRRSISIPCYTPAIQLPYLYFPPPPTSSQQSSIFADSDDEHCNYRSPLVSRRASQPPVLDDDSDWDADSEADPEPSWEDVSFLRSPSVSATPPPVKVKRESDVQIMLDAWDHQDSLDYRLHSVEAEVSAKVKVEELDTWNWEKGYQDYLADDEGALFIKEEETPSTLQSHHSAPSPSASTSAGISTRSSLEPFLRSSTDPPSHHDTTTTTQDNISPLPSTLVNLIRSMTMDSPLSEPCVSPEECSTSHNVIFPCSLDVVAPISATHIEGIPVYHMPLGSFNLLRRIDTDFVNLEPIATFAGTLFPVWSTIPNTVVVTHGSPWIVGSWVSLSTAQEYVRDHRLTSQFLTLFLSDRLFEHFPASLQDYHRTNSASRKLEQFGPPFGSALQSQVPSDVSSILPSPHPTHIPIPEEQHGGAEDHYTHDESPLSPTEQEMFQALCTHSGWDDESAPPDPTDAAQPVPVPATPRSTKSPRLTLRRSKRVADAIAAQTQTQGSSNSRTRRRGSRNNVS